MMRMQLWDTAGQERFRSLIPNYIRDCQAALIVFDLTNQESYDNVSKWVDFVKEHRGDDALLVVVGNKLDLTDDIKIQHDVATQKFQDMGIKYYELSAKTGENVQKMFQELCAQLMQCSETNLPLEIQQSKVVTNVKMEKQANLKKQVKSNEDKQASIQISSGPTKLSRKNVAEQRRVKQKQCC